MKRLADSDHAALILARRLHARRPHAEDFQILDVHDGCEDNGNNQEHISDVSVSQAERDDTETRPALTTGPTLPRMKEKQVPTVIPTSRRNVETVFLKDPQSQRVTQTTTTEGQQQEGITEAATEGTMAHNDLKGNGSKALQRVRDNSTNETSAKVYAKQVTNTRQPLTQTTPMGSETIQVQALLAELQRLEAGITYDASSMSAWVGPRKSPTLFYLAKFNHI